jgi:tetratricopeptide (TPR) repeat protein
MRKVLIGVLGIFILSALAANGQESGNIVRNRFTTEFERTTQVIEHARNVIRQSGNQQGMELLKMAIKMQEQARNAAQIRQFEAGLKYTLEARERARAAIALNQRAEENENLVQKQLEKTDQLISRVRERINGQTADNIRRALQTASQNQQRAWEFYRQGQFRPALKMSHQAEKMIRGIIERYQNENNIRRRLENMIQRLEERFAQLRMSSGDCGKEEAENLMNRAEEQFAKGMDLLSEGKFKRAQKTLTRVQKTIRRMERLCQEQNLPDAQLRDLQRKLERLRKLVQQQNNRQAHELMESAQEHIEKATRLCRAGNDDACGGHIRAALLLMRKAGNLLE